MPPRRGKRKDFHFSRTDWLGNLTDDEVAGMIAIIDKRTPKGKDLSVQLQRRWVIYQLILREIVAKRTAISYSDSLRTLMTAHNLTEQTIHNRLSAIYNLYRRRLVRTTAV